MGRDGEIVKVKKVSGQGRKKNANKRKAGDLHSMRRITQLHSINEKWASLESMAKVTWDSTISWMAHRWSETDKEKTG